VEPRAREVVDIAARMLSGEIELIEGCRLINDLRWDLDADGHSRHFDEFVAFEQQAFSFPSREARKLWNAEYLAELDREAEALLAERGPRLRKACEELIRSYSPTKGG